VLSQILDYLTLPYLLEGAVIAIKMWFISFALSFVAGLALALIRNAKGLRVLRAIVSFYIWLLRGTPIILQLVIWYNMLPLLGYDITEFWTAVIALSICFSAYLCEVFRGGLLAVQPGQIEAARALGFGPVGATVFFVIPQALRVAFPSLINFAILLMKDTSITSVIAVNELTLRANTIVARNFEYIPVFAAALIIYLTLTTLLSMFQRYAESSLNYDAKEARLRRKKAVAPVSADKRLGDYLSPTSDLGSDGNSVIFDKVNKSFGDNKVLDDVSLGFKSGRTTCIMGPSGAGKSTLLRTINGLEDIDSGTITVNGVVMSGKRSGIQLRRNRSEFSLTRDRRHSGTAMVFQQFHLFQNYSVLENMTLAPRIVKHAKGDSAASEGQNLLELFGLAHLGNRMPQRLSGGEQQRIGILRALATKPKTLLFDEPTSALDPERVGEVLDVMEELSDAGGTMIVVTHEVEFAKRCADWVIFMEHGRIVVQGTPEDILENPTSERLKTFLAGIGKSNNKA
jgi:polar amino acid transport system permease protein